MAQSGNSQVVILEQYGKKSGFMAGNSRSATDGVSEFHSYHQWPTSQLLPVCGDGSTGPGKSGHY
jgi:hypothetical protein